VTEYINRYLAEKGIGINDLRSVGNKSLREELIKLLVEKSNLFLRGIAETLGLNCEMVRKVQVSKDLSPVTFEKIPPCSHEFGGFFCILSLLTPQKHIMSA
jgi:hypothetical protein